MSDTEPWVLIHRERPWTVNTERTWHHHKLAIHKRQWRAVFAALALEERIPHIDGPVCITAMPISRDLRLQDAGGCYPAVKAAIDGLVDAGVLDGDGPAHVAAILLLAPDHKPDYGDALAISIDRLDP